MSKTITKICEKCQTVFDGNLKEHNRGGARFCSQSCASQRPRGEKVPNCVCANIKCAKSFYRSASKIKLSRSGLQFCSRPCKEKCQCVGENEMKAIQPDHYGSGEEKYREKALSTYPHRCIDCDYNIIAVLQVHHLDGNRKNSHLENLVIICPTHHKERHLKIRSNINYSGDIVIL